jgi:hypothetical protein
MMAALDERRGDVAIGACPQRASSARKFAWTLMRSISGLRFEDITSGFRIYRRKAIDVLSSAEATLLDYQDIGVLLMLQSDNCHIVEVSVVMYQRSNGASRIFSSWGVVFSYMAQSLLLGLSKRLVR